MKKTLISIAMIALCACAGEKEPSLVGKWVMPIPGQEPAVQGMELCADGTAKSINMHTLTLISWEQKKDSLFIKATSEGSGEAFTSIDTLKISKITQDSLFLSDGEVLTREQ
ncbi:MAG: lipocalin family protein [Flavobacteriales bacterium]|nr:lipocalin family protein [Flavobacteriales bacterium]